MSAHVVIFAGGTGGHVFPALAVAECLREQGYQVSWVGTAERIEARLVPAAGFPFHCMAQQGLRGKGALGYLKAPFRLLASVLQARRLLKEIKADLVLGFGGYTAGPGGIAAKLAGLPLIIHEQNAVPGMTNKILAKFANETLIGFSAAQEQLPKAHWVGNPVRSAVLAVNQATARAQEQFRVLVIGGSLGAQVFNETVPAALQKWTNGEIKVTHQCGQGRKQETLNRYSQCPGQVRVNVHEFIEDMPKAYAHHDLIICRAGALTVAEVAAAGIASILVPYPHAVDDHQTRNAEVLVMQHAGVLIPQQKLTPDHLLSTLQELNAVPEKIRQMGTQARTVAMPDATDKIVAYCQPYLNKQGVV